jgi:hypothetical protein
MATEKETIILDFQVEQGDAISELEKTKKSIIQLKEEQKELNKAYKDGNVTVDEYAAEQVRLEAILKKQTNQYNTVQKSVTGVKTQFDKLIDSNKGIQKSLESTTGSLAALVPGFGAASSGINAVSMAGKAFIATPIGAVVGALALAFGSLVTYIKGSDEAGDRFAKTTAALGFVFEKLKIVVENVGGFIFDTIEFIAGGVEKVIGFISPAAGAAIEAAKKAGEELANLQDDIEDRENDFLVKRAEINEKVQTLREKAIKQEGALKRATIQEAIDLEKSLAAEETKLAQDRLAAFKLENRERIENEKLSADQKKQLRTLEADIINQRAQGAQATIKFQKEVEKLNDEEAKQREKRNEQLAEEIRLKNQLEQVNSRTYEQSKFEIEQAPLKIKGELDKNAAINAVNKANEKQAANTAKYIANEERKQAVTEATIGTFGQLATTIALLAGRNKDLALAGIALERATAISQIVSNTGIANAKAVAATPLTFGQPFVGINTVSAALSIATVLAQAVQSFGEVSKAAGGGRFMTKGPTLLMVGDNPGGVERVTVEPISGRGQTVVKGNMAKMAGGGVLETQSVTGPINAAMAFRSTLDRQPIIYASWKEATELNTRIQFKESLVTV